jgi:hypothetical protein
MKKEFTIFKQGTTAAPVTILSHPSEPFNKRAKVLKFIHLGYSVHELNGKEWKLINKSLVCG